MIAIVLLPNHRNTYEKPNNALVAAINHFTFNDCLWDLCEAQINLLEIHVILGVANLLCRWLSANRAECLVEAKEYVGWYIVIHRGSVMSCACFCGCLVCVYMHVCAYVY